MKDLITDANFPKTAEGAVYHLGLKAGQLASRIITVGDPARARGIAKLFDPLPSSSISADIADGGGPATIEPELFSLHSERGFLTLTGKYKGVPISIVAIGMGAPNMDFFVRECREILDDSGIKDMIIIRFGSCGGLVPDLPVGSLTIPKSAIAVNRNYDFDFVNADENYDGYLDAYKVSKPTNADPVLHQLLLETLREMLPSTVINDDHMNASADSFYSSQGRNTSFPDHNEGLVDKLAEMGVGSLEMETFHLLHLANSWPRRRQVLTPIVSRDASGDKIKREPSVAPPPTNMPAKLHIHSSFENLQEAIASGRVDRTNKDGTSITTGKIVTSPVDDEDDEDEDEPRIRAAAVQMIFAERYSRAFISPEAVEALQNVAAKGLLETLVRWK